MNKKELLIPFIAFGLTLAFAFVSFAVILSNGGSKKWIARKMRLGGLLLTLSYVSCGNNHFGDDEQFDQFRTCYDIAFGNNKIEIEKDTNNVIYGSIGRISDEDLSFSIVDERNKIRQKENILTMTYMPDPYSKEFAIEINKNLGTGRYQFNLYNCKTEEQIPDNLIYKYQFNFNHE